MFALLDTRIGVKVLSDLILSYLPLRFIDYTNDDVPRLYQSTRGIGGLVTPRRVFTQTVWADRLSSPDSPNGIKLYALRVLGEAKEDMEGGRPFPKRTTIYTDILTSIQHPSHSLCNSAIRKLISSNQENITNQEYEYLNNHFCFQLLNIFYEHLERKECFEITQSGVGEFLAHLIHTVGGDDQCTEVVGDLIGWIVEKLGEDTGTFRKYVLVSNEGKFKELIHIADGLSVNPEEIGKIRAYLSNNPPLLAV
jgi:hypothetical protein